MRCKICQNEFVPSKYRPKQQVCSRSQCQKARQIENLKAWRLRNPDYFKCLGQETSWRQDRYRYIKLWKEAHREKIREYGASHKEQRQEYMREYMRAYRQKPKIVNGNKS